MGVFGAALDDVTHMVLGQSTAAILVPLAVLTLVPCSGNRPGRRVYAPLHPSA